MLGARIASTAVLIPAVLLLLYLGPETTALGTGLAAIIATYEFYTMAARSPHRYRLAYLPGYAATAAFSLVAYLRYPVLMLAIIAALALLALPFVWLARPVAATVPATTENYSVAGQGMNWALSLFGPVYVGVPLALIALIRADIAGSAGLWWIVLICLATWGADTGGYFFGRFFGKHPLAPKISPKKTIEGAIGGVAVSTLGVMLVGGLALDIPFYWTLPLGMVLAVVSILGDLFESWVKRRFDTKDSGKLIPGHGGLLDRIDSFLAVTLVAYLFMLFYI